MGMSTTAKLGEKTVMVRELTLQEIHDITTAGESSPAEAICGLLETCTNITRKDLMPCAPSDIDPLVSAISEVNQSFLDQANALGMEELAVSFANLIKSIFTIAFLPSSDQDTDN